MLNNIKNYMRYALRYKISHCYRESAPYTGFAHDGESSSIPEAERSGDLGISLALISK